MGTHLYSLKSNLQKRRITTEHYGKQATRYQVRAKAAKQPKAPAMGRFGLQKGSLGHHPQGQPIRVAPTPRVLSSRRSESKPNSQTLLSESASGSSSSRTARGAPLSSQMPVL